MKARIAVVILLALLLLTLTGSPAVAGLAQSAVATPHNLITNGSFEEDWAGWTKGGASIGSLISTTVVHDGEKSYQLDTTTVNQGSFIYQAVPDTTQDFELKVFVFRGQSNNTVELIRDWNPGTGGANFVTEVNFAYPADTVQLRAWNTVLATSLIWPVDSWHELTIVGDWSEATQQFFIDGRLIGTIHASTVFSPQYLIVGDVRYYGWHARYFYDNVRLFDEARLRHIVYLPLTSRGLP